MHPDEDLTDEQADDLMAWGDRMDGKYKPPILAEPKGGPVPGADPTLDQVRAMAEEPDLNAIVAGLQWDEPDDDTDDETHGPALSPDDVDNMAVHYGDGDVQRAGHDVTPGHNEFRHYWTEDPEGLAKWVDKPKPWTALYHHLLKHIPAEMAKRVAAQWFHRVFHFWPGSDLNRVTHGHAPRGHRVGPG